MVSKAKGLNATDKQSFNSKLMQSSSSKVSNEKLLSNTKLKSKTDQSEALKIGKFIIEKVLLPKIFGKPVAKKKPKPEIVPEPVQPPKPSTADAKKNVAKTLPPVIVKPKRILKKKAPVVIEPTYKNQSTTTDDLNEVDAKVDKKGAKRAVKAKPKTAPAKKPATATKEQVETIVEPNIAEISAKSTDLMTSEFQGGGSGDGDLIISEITVKFCRRN